MTTQTYEFFIRTSPEQLWQAMTDPSLTPKYFFGTSIQTDLTVGGRFDYSFPSGMTAVRGQILEIEPGRKLVHSWQAMYDEGMSREQSRVTWLIEQKGQACLLTAIHELDGAPLTAKHVGRSGWSLVLSGLKTLLETGSPLEVPMGA